jgi:subtilisin
MADPWHFDDLSIRELQQQSLGEGVRVLVLDSGVTPVSGAFRSLRRLAPDGSPSIAEDRDGHGTACASLIASQVDDAPGIAPGVDLVAMRVVAGRTPVEGEVAAAFATAIALNCNIVSCSFTLHEPEEATLDLIREAADRGIVVVAAAGNDPDVKSAFPERTPKVLVVGAYDESRELVRGRRGRFTDVYAPGDDLPALFPNGLIRNFGQSSAAAAVTSGVIALVLSIARDQGLDRLGLVIDGLARKTADESDGVRRLNALNLLSDVQRLG